MQSMNLRASSTLAIASLLAFASCDEAKKFIDPSGNAYGKPAEPAKRQDSAKKTEEVKRAPSAPTASKASPAPAAATYRDSPPLTARAAMDKAQDMLLTTPRGWVEFHKGRAIAMGRHLTLWDGNETPWGLGIVDLDQDGADDAILAVRSTSARDTSWTLAVLVDRAGKLQCIQSIPLASVDRISSLEATQGGVLVVPETGSPQLFGWVGGELVGNP